MKDRTKLLDQLHRLYRERDHAADMIEAYSDLGDSIGMEVWSYTEKDIDKRIARCKQALTKAGTFGTFANPATPYMEVWA
jgi:hypothetical protein